MTIVKVERPIVLPSMVQRNYQWIVTDQLQSRVELLYENEVPKHIMYAMLQRPRNTWCRFKAFFDNAQWDYTNHSWNLTKATLTKDKRW